MRKAIFSSYPIPVRGCLSCQIFLQNHMMAHVQGVKNYSHCPLKKRPLSYVCEDIDDDQPQDLSIKRRRSDEDDDDDAENYVRNSPTFSHTAQVYHHEPPPPMSAHNSGYFQNPAFQTPPSPPRMTPLADFYLKLFQTTAVQQNPPQYDQHPDLWNQAPMWAPMSHQAPGPHPSLGHHGHHALAPPHTALARHLMSPHPSEDRLASPGSTASEDSGVGTETLSEDEIDVTGDSEESPRKQRIPEDCSSSSSSGSSSSSHVTSAMAIASSKVEVVRYSCTECRKSYSTYSGLSKHKQFHCASLGHKSFGCKHCDKVYTSLGALKMHIRTHTLPCKCPLCGKAFSRPWLLQGHIRTHTGEKPFQCPQCDRCFADRSNLRAHLQTHADVKKYACSTCHKTFSRVSLLNKHVESSCPARLLTEQH